MMKLVLVLTVFVILNGFIHSHPSSSLNKLMERQKKILECTKFATQQDKILSTTSNDPVNDPYIQCKIFDDKSSKHDGDKLISETDDLDNKKRDGWQGRLNPFDKLWRLPRIENEDLPMVFILRTDEFN